LSSTKVVSHGRYVGFQSAEVAIRRNRFAGIVRLIAELCPLAAPMSRAWCAGSVAAMIHR
jgi:hypothetical protein